MEIDPRLLDRAVEAARRALKNMDEDMVPAALRQVGASSARRLPPPRAALVARYLDREDWLRELALEEWAEADIEAVDEAAAASALFLIRPDGWEERLAGLSDRRRAGAVERARSRLEEENRRVARRIEQRERRLSETPAAPPAPDSEVVDRLTASNRALRADLVRAERRIADLEVEVAGGRGDLDEADRRITELRRRGAPRKALESHSGPSHTFGSGDPIGLARTLDDLVRSVVRPPEPPVLEPAEPRRILPAGVAPDSAMAIDWLLEGRSPVTVLIDGYNIAHELSPEPTASVRARVDHAAARLRRLAESPLTAVVMWDSRLSEDRRDVAGAVVRFVPNADDALVAEAAAVAGDVVVITSDREVRERSEAVGAVGLWSQALLAWMQRG